MGRGGAQGNTLQFCGRQYWAVWECGDLAGPATPWDPKTDVVELESSVDLYT
jgi:hypothetical protein